MTPYDLVAYPTALFPQTHPERLGVLAHLHGLAAPAPTTARVLEIGCGDAMSLLAFAASYPGAEVHGFDLSETAVARGQDYVRLGGIANASLAVEDILAAHRRYPAGAFDYVIAHGIYAWVPEPVRRATMALIGHALAPDGVAFVSYNALPGGHVRMILREMIAHVLEDVADPAARLGVTREFLAEYAKPGEADEPLLTAVRAQAASMLERPDGVLFHDELGPEYAPQSLAQVVAAAAALGLRFLSDAGRNRHLDGFLADGAEPSADPERAAVRAAQLDDFLTMRFFRQTVFVREAARPRRSIDLGRLDPLLVSTNMVRAEDGSFVHGTDRIELPDAALAARLAQAAADAPRRQPVATLAASPPDRRTLLKLFSEWHVRLHLGPEPFVLTPGARPRTSGFARAQLALGERFVCTLDHRLLAIDQPELRALLLAADGSRTLAELEALADLPFPRDQIAPALAAAAGRALLGE